MPLISVIVCTHNPRKDYFRRTIEAIRAQTMPLNNWELVIVNNASSNVDIFQHQDLSWHPSACIVEEARLGLTWARIRGIRASLSDIIIFFDDDNVPDPEYIKNVAHIFERDPMLGAAGGKSIPEFEEKPEPWIMKFSGCLAIRDLGDKEILFYSDSGFKTKPQYPSCAPIGAGLAIRRKLAENYITKIIDNKTRLLLGRAGKLLTSGEDNDIVLTILEARFGVGYFPQLKLRHLIPKKRLTRSYLAQLNYASYRSWVTVLDVHGIRPWSKVSRWSVGLRKIKAYLQCRAWSGAKAYVEWRGLCGQYEARAGLS